MLPKREGCLLAEEFLQSKHNIGGRYMSVKLDGQRILWDGGISLGIDVVDIPWAFNPKRGLKSTGLWSRNFKAVMASKEFIDRLPIGLCLDGEAWLGNGRFEELESIVRRDEPDARWKEVQYKCFDSPALGSLFEPGRMRIRGTDHLIDCTSFVQALRGQNMRSQQAFEYSLQLIPSQLRIEQERLPLNEEHAVERVMQKLEEVTSLGGEGVMLRTPHSVWEPRRSKNLLKVKKFYDAEATVVGYESGSGRLAGTLGALVLEGQVPVRLCEVETRLQRFQLSGFTDEERARASTLFPVGSTITYRYNDITGDGLPRFLRYYRKRNND